MRRLLAVALLSGALLVPAPAVAYAEHSTDIVTALKNLPGVTFLRENPTAPAGYRYFTLEIRQPIDHRHPERGHFEQQLRLLHRDTQAPMVAYTGGYFNYDYLSEPAQIVDGNELIIEHRYFGDSVPAALDNYRFLDIWQEATDEHAIVSTLHRIYRANWIATGISKGGMTAVYHDRFYPNDYAGTLAYSSPDDITDHGHAYIDFINRVGTPQCRADLRRVQVEALQHRTELEAMMGKAATDAGLTFTESIGSLDKAFEFDVIFLQFVFWQYGSLDQCATIPPPGAPMADLYSFYDNVVGWLSLTDQGNGPFLPYYYQAGTQLDYPIEPQAHLLGLLRYPFQESAQAYLPAVPMRFDRTVMPDVDRWVRTQGRHLIFTYGSLDPYGATPFRLGPGSRDSFVYTLAGGSHLSLIENFPAADQAAISSTLRRWAGVTTPASLATPRFVAQAPPRISPR